MSRLFGPSVQFSRPVAPVNELVTAFCAHVSRWLPDGLYPSTTWDDEYGLLIVFWPMTAADYTSWGCMLMEQLHEAVVGCSAEDGNEFLCCYESQSGKTHQTNSVSDWPAKAIYAALYISDDGGVNWRDKDQLQLVRPGESNQGGVPHEPS